MFSVIVSAAIQGNFAAEPQACDSKRKKSRKRDEDARPIYSIFAQMPAPYGNIFLAPGTPESQWTNVISARQSTLGFLFAGPDLGDFGTLARFETCFLNSMVDANVYGLAQYYLYAKLISDDWAFTGGVTNSLVNPLAPSVLNASSGSDFGNLGFMRPQLRAERFIRVTDNLLITPQFALSSPVGTDFFQQPTTGPEGIQLGEENGWPNIEGRLAVGVGQKSRGSTIPPAGVRLLGRHW